MSTHYITNESSGNQYYFNSTNATTSHSYGNYSSPVTSTYGSSVYSAYPISISSTSNQQTHVDNSYHTPQQYQSVAGFNKSVTQHEYQPSHSSTPQVRATARAVTNQDLYTVQRSPQPIFVSPQQHHFQFDKHQQPGHPTGTPVVYQTPGAAQFTHRNVDLWTEGSPLNQDHYVQAQRVSVRSVSTGSPQQSHSVSPQRHQDQLQKYYSQLTPEQHQQLLRNQQLQRQQEQNSHHEQQHYVTAHQISPSSNHHHHHGQHVSNSGFDGGHNNQQRRVRSDSERQQQDEQDYHAAQQRLAAQRAQQQQVDPGSHPVGIRSLASKFVGPESSQPRSKSTSARHYSSSNQTYKSGPRQTTTTHSLKSHMMTYSSLPKPHEPPVNSVEYYQMQKQAGAPFASIQQAAAPPHIQHAATGFGALRDQFTTGSHADGVSQPEIINRQQQQQPTSIPNGGNSLSSLRNQFINQAKQSTHEQSAGQQAPKISRTIVGEDIPQLYQAQQASVYQPPIQQQKPISSQAYPQQQQQQQPAPQAASKPQQQPIIQITQTQQQKPVIQVTQPQPQQTPPQQQQQSAPQTPVQQKQDAAPQAPVKQEQEATPQTPVKQEQESAPQTPVKQEQEAAPQTPVKQEPEAAPQTPPQEEKQSTPEAVSPPKQESAPEASQKQAEPDTEVPKQQTESTPQTPKPKAEATAQTAKPKTESTTQAAKQQSPSAASTAKKEPAKAATKPADKK